MVKLKTNDEFLLIKKSIIPNSPTFFPIISGFQLTLLRVNRFTPSPRESGATWRESWHSLAISTRLPLFRTSVRHFLQTDGVWQRGAWQKQEDNLRSDGSTWQESRIIVVVVCASSLRVLSPGILIVLLFFLFYAPLIVADRDRICARILTNLKTKVSNVSCLGQKNARRNEVFIRVKLKIDECGEISGFAKSQNDVSPEDYFVDFRASRTSFQRCRKAWQTGVRVGGQKRGSV